MSDKEKTPRPHSRRPSYLSGPVGSAKAAPPQEAVPKKEEAPPEVPDTELLRWTIWLLPRRPALSVVVILVVLGSVYAAYWAYPNILFVGIITLIMTNRLAPYLFPVTYILTEQTAGYKAVMARDVRPWARVFTYYDYPDGVLLANDTRGLRGRLREGMFLYYETGAANRDQILDVVRSKLKSPQEAMAPKPDEPSFKGGVGSAMRRVKKLKQKD